MSGVDHVFVDGTILLLKTKRRWKSLPALPPRARPLTVNAFFFWFG